MKDKPPYYMFWLLAFFIIVTLLFVIIAMAKGSSVKKIPFLKSVASGEQVVMMEIDDKEI